jgi:uncharacterized membrane protein
VIDQERSHWKVKGPVGTSVEFDARTTEMDPDRGVEDVTRAIEQ